MDLLMVIHSLFKLPRRRGGQVAVKRILLKFFPGRRGFFRFPEKGLNHNGFVSAVASGGL
ncbi:MAG: hypothetical protein ABS58_07415 [Mesorhizobium sp. SCN 65-20]|nr:MAG: hypothetical protein ABS58_07415 [Mesorhizobium sp. SCN 65-20]